MITISIILNLIGGLFFYSLSDKTIPSIKDSILKWIHQNKKISKIIGGGLLCIALFLLMFSCGILSGALLGFFLLSLEMCLIIVITPLQILNYKWVVLMIGLCLIVEIFIK